MHLWCKIASDAQTTECVCEICFTPDACKDHTSVAFALLHGHTLITHISASHKKDDIKHHKRETLHDLVHLMVQKIHTKDTVHTIHS